jgi:reversibly glycosylated polypeptide / UDP-arabinopyranose mutase
MMTYIVIPTIRERSIKKFLHEWDFGDCRVVVVEDNPERSFDLPGGVVHVSHAEIDRDLGKSSWIIPRKTDCVRSYGYYYAWREGADTVITLDDDCYPNTYNSTERIEFIDKHKRSLTRTAESIAWCSTIGGVRARGVPYENTGRIQEVLINHGLWHNVPDMDAMTQISNPVYQIELKNQVIPRGMYYPMCGMNLAFKREAIPMMYFFLMGERWGRDRFGDIWCGIISKKICDHLGYSVTSGEPHVYHSRASNMWVNLRKEVTGYEDNEMLWRVVDGITLTNDNVIDCYTELASKLKMPGDYWVNVKKAMYLWAELYE